MTRPAAKSFEDLIVWQKAHAFGSYSRSILSSSS